MKISLLVTLSVIILSCAGINPILAQKVEYKKETITVDGESWATMKRKGTVITGRIFTLIDDIDTKVAIAKEINDRGQDEWFKVVFPATGRSVEFKAEGFSAGKALAKAFVESEVLKDGIPSEAGITSFCELYGNSHYNKLDLESKSTASEFVERDTRSIIFVANNDIKQGGKVIGNYFEKRSMYQGKRINQITIKLPSGTRIAVIRLVGVNAQSGILTTFPGNRKHEISFVYSSAYLKEIAEFLVENGYM